MMPIFAEPDEGIGPQIQTIQVLRVNALVEITDDLREEYPGADDEHIRWLLEEERLRDWEEICRRKRIVNFGMMEAFMLNPLPPSMRYDTRALLAAAPRMPLAYFGGDAPSTGDLPVYDFTVRLAETVFASWLAALWEPVIAPGLPRQRLRCEGVCLRRVLRPRTFALLKRLWKRVDGAVATLRGASLSMLLRGLAEKTSSK